MNMAETTEKAAKNKKINKMSAADIETKLNELRTAQGGLKSGYAQMLLKRKKTLGK
jgi:ribosomal protein L29